MRSIISSTILNFSLEYEVCCFEHMDLVFVSYDREYFELAETTAIQYNIIPLLNKYLEQATELLDDAAGRYYNACKRLLSAA